MKLQGKIIADGLKFPEGPVAMPDGSVIVVEVGGGRLSRVLPAGGVEVIAELGGGPNGAAIGQDGHCYVCNNGGFAWLAKDGFMRPHGIATDYETGSIQKVDLKTGRFETLYRNCGDIPLRGPNDLVFDKNGGFWFSDMGKIHGRLLDRGAVFYARADGSLIKQVIFPIMTPNGVGISPDGTTLYVSETETSRLWAYPITGEGEVAQEPWPSPNGGRLVYGMEGFQRFDSMALEESGHVCVATLVRGGISVISPAGKLVEFHEAPEVYCTNICFGGPDRKTAFITLSGYGQVMAVPWERAGLALNF